MALVEADAAPADAFDANTVAKLFSEGLGGTRDKLFQAACIGDVEHVRYLLERGNSPNVKDFDGDTVLSAAAEYGRAMISLLLLEKDAVVNSLNYIGWTPLFFAAVNDHLEVAYHLLRAGARVNGIEHVHMRTPLHMAARWGHTRMCKMLIDAGAFVYSREKHARTPFEEAVRYNFHETAGLIEALMMDVDERAIPEEKQLSADYIYDLMPEIADRPMEQWELCQWLRWATAGSDCEFEEEKLPKIGYEMVTAGLNSRLAISECSAEELGRCKIKVRARRPRIANVDRGERERGPCPPSLPQMNAVKYLKKHANSQLPTAMRPKPVAPTDEDGQETGGGEEPTASVQSETRAARSSRVSKDQEQKAMLEAIKQEQKEK